MPERGSSSQAPTGGLNVPPSFPASVQFLETSLGQATFPRRRFPFYYLFPDAREGFTKTLFKPCAVSTVCRFSEFMVIVIVSCKGAAHTLLGGGCSPAPGLLG